MRHTYTQAPTQKLSQEDDDLLSQQSLSLQFSSQNLAGVVANTAATGIGGGNVVEQLVSDPHRVRIIDRKKLSSIRTPGEEEEEEGVGGLDVDERSKPALVEEKQPEEDMNLKNNSAKGPSEGSIDLLNEEGGGARGPLYTDEEEEEEEEAEERGDESAPEAQQEEKEEKESNPDSTGATNLIQSATVAETLPLGESTAPHGGLSSAASPGSDDGLNLAFPVDQLQSVPSINKLTATEPLPAATPSSDAVKWMPQVVPEASVTTGYAVPVISPPAISGSVSMLDEPTKLDEQAGEEGEEEQEEQNHEPSVTPSENVRQTVSATLLALSGGGGSRIVRSVAPVPKPQAEQDGQEEKSVATVTGSSQDEFAFKGDATSTNKKKMTSTWTPRSSEAVKPDPNLFSSAKPTGGSSSSVTSPEDDDGVGGSKKKKPHVLGKKRLVFGGEPSVASPRNGPKATKTVELSEDEATRMWNTCWAAMRAKGWGYRSGSGHVEWIYLAPGVSKVSEGVKNETKFESLKSLMEWIIRNDSEIAALYHGEEGEEQDRSDDEGQANGNQGQVEGPEDVNQDDDLNETLTEDEATVMWNACWPTMRAKGWGYRAGSGHVEWIYLAPGINKISEGVKNETKFESIKNLMEWIRRNDKDIAKIYRRPSRPKTEPKPDQRASQETKKESKEKKSASKVATTEKPVVVAKNSGTVKSEDEAETETQEDEKFWRTMYNRLWPQMKASMGWKSRGGGGLVDWVYVPPASAPNAPSQFDSHETMLRYVKKEMPEFFQGALHAMLNEEVEQTRRQQQQQQQKKKKQKQRRTMGQEEEEEDEEELSEADGETYWLMLYNRLWPTMKVSGWKAKTGGGLVDWIYVPPASYPNAPSQFVSVEGMFRYLKTDIPDVFAALMRGETTLGTGTLPAKQEATVAKKETKKSVRLEDAIQWDTLWKHLRRAGWSHKAGAGLTPWYYVLPGKVKSEGVRHVDYFKSPDEVFDYCTKHPEHLKGLVDEETGKDFGEIKWAPSSYVPDDDLDEISPPKRMRRSTGTGSKKDDSAKLTKDEEEAQEGSVATSEKDKSKKKVTSDVEPEVETTINTEGNKVETHVQELKNAKKSLDKKQIPNKDNSKEADDDSKATKTVANDEPLAVNEAAQPKRSVVARSSKTPPAIRMAQMMQEEGKEKDDPSPSLKKLKPAESAEEKPRSFGTPIAVAPLPKAVVPAKVESPSSSTSEPLVKLSSPSSSSSSTIGKTNIFAGMGFSLTGFDTTPGRGSFSVSEMREMIEVQGGGVVVKKTHWGSPSELGLQSVVVIARPGSYRTEKYVCAIAKQKPVFHPAWIRECLKAGKLVDALPFVLPLSFMMPIKRKGRELIPSDSTDDYLFEYNPSSVILENPSEIYAVNKYLFESREFLILGSDFWVDLITFCGGTCVKEALANRHVYVLVAMEDLATETVETVKRVSGKCAGVLTYDWVLQCLLQRKLLAPEDNPLRFVYQGLRDPNVEALLARLPDRLSPFSLASGRDLTLLGPRISDLSDTLGEFLSFRLGAKRFELGDFVVFRAPTVQHEDLLAIDAPISLATFGRIRKIFFEAGPKNVGKRYRVTYDQLSLMPNGLLKRTGQIVETDLDLIFAKFVCVPMLARRIDETKLIVGCFSVENVDWRDRVYLLGL